MVEVECFMFLNNLHSDITSEDLKRTLQIFGPIWYCKVARDSNGSSLGSAYVYFLSTRSVKHAASTIDGKLIYGKPVRARSIDVNPCVEDTIADIDKRFYLHVSNLDTSIPDDTLHYELLRLFKPPHAFEFRTRLLFDKDRQTASCFLSFDRKEDALRVLVSSPVMKGRRLQLLAASSKYANTVRERF
ncbi:uncharacterized protein LOC143040256 [Oratosquilla oratoria]|uniref:uncharacterized protein LOC143040256 n=1 Tax=Oratosquilla oratoria TaxID=337810 RepID=UPI003F763CF7